MGKKWYVVLKGRIPGIYDSWAEAQKHVNGFQGAVHRSYSRRADAVAAFRKESVAVSSRVHKHSSTPSHNNTSQIMLSNAQMPIPKAKSPPHEKTYSSNLVIYTDGSYQLHRETRQPISGYGIVVEYQGKHQLEISGFVQDATPTNQRAELYAIYTTLYNLKHIYDIFLSQHRVRNDISPFDKVKVEIRSDSQYSIGCLTKWYMAWERNGWKRSNGSTPANLSLIQACLSLLKSYSPSFEIYFTHVSAHSGIPGNERADGLANEGAYSGMPISFVRLD